MQAPFSDLALVELTNTADQVVPSLAADGAFQPPPAGYAGLAAHALLPVRARATAPVSFRLFDGGLAHCCPEVSEGDAPQVTAQSLWVRASFPLFETWAAGLSKQAGYFVYRFPTAALAGRLRQALAAHYPAGVVPQSKEGHHVRAAARCTGPGAVEAVTREAQLGLWWEGMSLTAMQVTPAAAAALVVELQPGDEVELSFAVASADPRSPGDNPRTYRVNLGFVADRLAKLGLLPAAAAQRLSGRATDAEGNVVRPGTTRLISFGRPEGAVRGAGGALQPLLVWGGSTDAVVVNPFPGGTGHDALRDDVPVPPDLFTFSAADRVHLASPALAAVTSFAHKTDPAVDVLSMLGDLASGWVAENAFTSGGKPFSVAEHTPDTVLAPDFRDYVAGEYSPRAGFHAWVAGHVVYEGEGILGHPLPPKADGYRDLLPNRDGLLRPHHGPFLNAQASQLRRSFPVRLQVRFGAGDDADRLVLTQDEVDVVRQEYILHMNWVQEDGGFYYQPTHAGNRDTPANSHQIVRNAAGAPIRPKAGTIDIPDRDEFRAIRRGEFDPVVAGARPLYEITVAPANWRQVYDGQIRPRYAAYRDAVKHAVAGASQPGDPLLPEIVRRFITFLRNLPPATTGQPVLDFLASLPNLTEALARLNLADNDALHISSFWRPPEHNETVSKVRGSPHQASRGFDVQPSGAGGEANRSPLSILALHAAAEDLLANTNTFTQCLLEDNRDEFVMYGFDEAYANSLVLRGGPANNPVYTVVRLDERVDVDEYYGGAEVPEESFPLPSRGIPTKNLLNRFHTEFTAYMTAQGRPTQWPNPTVNQLYFYALAFASHIHFTLAPR